MSELIACHHKVTLDIAKRDVCTIEVVNQDTANILEVNVCENGKEVSLENATLITITYSNDTVEEMQISEDFKTASVRINANCLKRGINFAKVCIYSGDNGLITAEMLTINCKQTVGSDNPAVPDPDMPKLKEMIEDAVAQAGGGAGLAPLVGTTQTITPSQVLAAIKAGRDIALQYTDSYYGTFVFGSFNANEKLGIVVSNSILPQMDGLTGTLIGFVDDAGWVFKATNTATKDDVGTAVNEALAAAKASGEFDGADGITPTIGDNGNWFLGDTDTGKPSRGDKGDKGDKGDAGDIGPAGPKGDTGATGATGADGKSAYSYAQDGGYIGTEEEFAAKLAAEGLDKALYVVNLTMDFDTMTPSVDKTFEEIKQVYDEGKYSIVLSLMGVTVTPLIALYPGSCIFVGVSPTHSDTATVTVDAIIITKDNVIQTYSDDLALKTDKLPNPYPLTFTGAVSETYDGSSAKTITIPSGGGSALAGLAIADNYDIELISHVIIDQDNIPTAGITVTQKDDGSPFAYDGLLIWTDAKSASSYTTFNFNGYTNYPIEMTHGNKNLLSMYITDGTTMSIIIDRVRNIIKQSHADTGNIFYPDAIFQRVPEKFTSFKIGADGIASVKFYKAWGLTRK